MPSPGRPKRTHNRAVIPFTERAVFERIARLAAENTWVRVAMHLNQHQVYRPGNASPWTASTARKFFERFKPEPERRKVRDVLPGLPQLPREPGAPQTLQDCPESRPCPWALCRFHMAEFYVRTNRHDTRKMGRLAAMIESGSLERLPYTCVLDVIDSGPMISGSNIGRLINMSREHVRRILKSGMDKAMDRDPDVGKRLRRWHSYSALGNAKR